MTWAFFSDKLTFFLVIFVDEFVNEEFFVIFNILGDDSSVQVHPVVLEDLLY